MTTTTMTENNNTPAEQFALALRKIGACSEARKWAEGLDYDTAWNTCNNPQWLLFLIKKFTPLSPIQNELLICRFAREVVHLTTDPRVLACIEAREAWARGEASDELREAAIATMLADAMAAARAGAWAAMDGVARDAAVAVGIMGTAKWAAAMDAAWDIAQTTAMDTAMAAAEAAMRATARAAAVAGGIGTTKWVTAMDTVELKQCDIIRELIPQPELSLQY